MRAPPTLRASTPINVVVWGSGAPAICVHGSLSWGTFAFREQRPLARTRALLLPDRHSYGSSPPTPRADFEVDAVDVAALLDRPSDLAGHSYGVVVGSCARGGTPRPSMSPPGRRTPSR